MTHQPVRGGFQRDRGQAVAQIRLVKGDKAQAGALGVSANAA